MSLIVYAGCLVRLFTSTSHVHRPVPGSRCRSPVCSEHWAPPDLAGSSGQNFLKPKQNQAQRTAEGLSSPDLAERRQATLCPGDGATGNTASGHPPRESCPCRPMVPGRLPDLSKPVLSQSGAAGQPGRRLSPVPLFQGSWQGGGETLHRHQGHISEEGL